jgi:hypothetical protein
VFDDDLNQYAATMHFNGQSTVVPCRAVFAAVIVTASPAASMTVTWGDAGWRRPMTVTAGTLAPTSAARELGLYVSNSKSAFADENGVFRLKSSSRFRASMSRPRSGGIAADCVTLGGRRAMAIFSPGRRPVEEPRDKGLKTGALGLVSSVVMGVASTAPA